jgi:hypothetical protein
VNLIINALDFVYNGILFWKKDGYCYILVEPSGRKSKAAHKNLLANKRISLDYYYECLEACKQNIAGGAA